MSNARDQLGSPSTTSPPLKQVRRLRSMRIGIAGHLAISFAAVGVLAVVANVIAEQGISIVEVTRFAAAPPVPRIEPQVVAPSRAVAPTIASKPNADAADLADAVERYAAAVFVRAQAPGQENDAELASPLRELQAAEAALDRSTAPTQQAFTTALRSYREEGERVIALADQQRLAIDTHAARLAAIDSRLTSSVDRGFRIFGRVLTREAILRLRADYAAMERAFAAFRTADAAGQDTAGVALVDSETTFERTLTEHQRELKRGESAEWLAEITAELERLRMLRIDLVGGSRQLQDAEVAFIRARAALASIPQPVATPVKVATIEKAPFVGPPVLDYFMGPLVDDLARAPTEPSTRVARQEIDKQKRRLVAVLTGGVLIVVLLISVGTVRSIVVPIRRLLKATNDLGKHGTHEPVPRGGIRELDTLGQSFNDMAQEILAARRNAHDQHVVLERRVSERTRQLQELAECDPLTGLPNRRHFRVLLEQALARRGNSCVAVLFLDLDNFKNINDSMGHGFGDDVLRVVALRLLAITGDTGFAARLGGDEFTVVLTSANSAADVVQAGLELIASFQSPLRVANRDLLISVSAGASICPDHDTTAEGLLKAADAALFRAKALGRSQLAVFTPELLAEAAAKFATEQGLRRALERGEFVLMFQPEISAETLRPVLVEALVRWRLPDGRLAAPSEFLAVAEESGLIAEIGDWVLRAAIQAAATWHHGEWPDACVAINVSARQLLDHRFVDKVKALLLEHDLPTRCIEIELTETVLQTGRATLDTLGQLHAAGIATALDDFGTGYSSLASLESLPFSRIKLDKSLIDSVATNTRSAAIARAIIWLCHSLGLNVTAEGIEGPEQLLALHSYRPLLLQGYLFSKPIAGTEVVAELRRLSEELPMMLAAAGSGSESLVHDLGVESRWGSPAEPASSASARLRRAAAGRR